MGKGVQTRENRRSDINVFNSCGQKHATTATNRVVVLGPELTTSKAANAWLVNIAAQLGTDTHDTQANLYVLRKCLDKVKKRPRLVTGQLDEALKQSAGSANAAEELLRQLREPFWRALLLGEDADFLKLQASDVAKGQDVAAGLAEEQGRHFRTIKARVGLLKNDLDLFRRKMSTGGNKEGESCNAEITKSCVSGLIDGLG